MMSGPPLIPSQQDVAPLLNCPVRQLPPFPQVAAHLMAISANDLSSAQDITRIVNTDPAIATRVLGLVNTPGMGLGRNAAKVQEAVVMLGFNRVRQLAIDLAIHDRMLGAVSKTFDTGTFWRHCLAVASIAQTLSIGVKGQDPDEAYIAGLLHDVGKIGWELFGKVRYSEYLLRLAESRICLPDAERSILGLDHADLGAFLARQWNLPESVARVIQLHHRPWEPQFGDERLQRLVAVVALADFITWSQGFGALAAQEQPVLHNQVEMALDLKEIQLEEVLRRMDQTITQTGDYYHFTFPGERRLRQNLILTSIRLARLGQAVPATPPAPPAARESLLAPHRSLNVRRIVTSTLEALHGEFDLEWVALYLVHPRQRELVGHFTLHHGVPWEGKEISLSLDGASGGFHQAVRGRRPLVTFGESPSERGMMQTWGVKALGLVPVLNRRRQVLGLLVIGAEGRGEDLAQVVTGVMPVARELGVALDHANMVRSMHRRASVDALTGLRNRMSMDRVLLRAVERSRKLGEPVVAVMMDIDHFKRFNDAYGHGAGDLVLKMVGEVLRVSTRATGYVGRIGGEEFLAVLPDTREHAGQRYGERIRRQVEKTGDLLKGRFPGVPLTISVGVAVLEDAVPDVATLMRCADVALYAAKGHGRNQVVVYDPMLPDDTLLDGRCGGRPERPDHPPVIPMPPIPSFTHPPTLPGMG